MKKLFALLMAGVLSLALTACGGTFENSSSIPDSGDAILNSTAYFGKISSVAGNEIELNLAKEPELPPQSESAPADDADEMAAAIMTPAVSTEEGSKGAATRVEVEYTGELKEFVIPAGMPILDALGNEKQLSDIKKGSIMNIFVDDTDTITEVFLYE
ncbi:MAG: hypothetical protein RR075_06315 [Pygmaiobacter sp.]